MSQSRPPQPSESLSGSSAPDTKIRVYRLDDQQFAALKNYDVPKFSKNVNPGNDLPGLTALDLYLMNCMLSQLEYPQVKDALKLIKKTPHEEWVLYDPNGVDGLDKNRVGFMWKAIAETIEASNYAGETDILKRKQFIAKKFLEIWRKWSSIDYNAVNAEGYVQFNKEQKKEKDNKGEGKAKPAIDPNTSVMTAVPREAAIVDRLGLGFLNPEITVDLVKKGWLVADQVDPNTKEKSKLVTNKTDSSQQFTMTADQLRTVSQNLAVFIVMLETFKKLHPDTGADKRVLPEIKCPLDLKDFWKMALEKTYPDLKDKPELDQLIKPQVAVAHRALPKLG